MNKSIFLPMALAVAMLCPQQAQADDDLYPGHFNLSEVTLLDSPMKNFMELNFKTLLSYDMYRLLTPYVRQSGLAATTDVNSPYYQWERKHPSFPNWGSNDFNLDGHVGGHYLTALALAVAACHDDDTTREQLQQRLTYMIEVMKDCQDAYDDNTEGLYGFIGGQPIMNAWTDLYKGNINTFRSRGGWVPFYCEHKIMAGLRDAYIYTGDATAKAMFRKMADWAVNLVGQVSDADMEMLLGIEHGGMNEVLADAYGLFGEKKYLAAAEKYSHKQMVDGMQTASATFLDGKHANTQVPKYIGFERIAQLTAGDATQSQLQARYVTAVTNFWNDVSEHRTTCIGGNSVNEHFMSSRHGNRYIDQLDGPESCNSNNMLKLAELMSDRTHDARFADFYEYTMWNHIMTTIDPQTGGYVYFTTLRPQGYRIYSQVNQGMWCCVGTGMENHSKYGHFIYTHEGKDKVYVNLFTPSKLQDKHFVLTQNTVYPYEPTTTITVGKSGKYSVCVRHPWWTTEGYEIAVNGVKQQTDDATTVGKSSYVELRRKWKAGDVITVTLPMTLRYAECPNYSDYIAFEYGPILLGAQTTAVNEAEASTTGLRYEKLQNEYAGAGRMDHSPGCMGNTFSLLQAPLLIGERGDVLSRIQTKDKNSLTFSIDVTRPGVSSYVWKQLELKPFYAIHHARYMCYWYQQTEQGYAASDMAQTEAAIEALAARTIDFVVPGEQQSEAGHEYDYSAGSTKGSYQGESYRDAKAGEHVQFSLFNAKGQTDSLAVMLRFTTADKGRKATLTIDGEKIADITIPAKVEHATNGFYQEEYAIPQRLLVKNGKAKEKFVVRLTASAETMLPGLYYLRLVSSDKK